MRVLDLYCCAGGAAMGYHHRGATVIGVDITPQPSFPFTFWHADALHIMRQLLDGKRLRVRNDEPLGLADFDFIHASPPCQAYTLAQRIQNREHPDLVAPTRELLRESGLPYVIENVVGAPLENPVMLCGDMFGGLRVYRHRLFESSFTMRQPAHGEHVAPIAKMGRPAAAHQYMHVVGNFSGVREAREAMGIGWMKRDELREAIPPKYTEYVWDEFVRAG